MQKPMDFTVWRSRVVREWPRIEKYQNSTLRYTPPKDFAAFWNQQNGRPSIIRTWVTLDEVWDYRTDTYNWDYDIGVNNYVDDKNHYTYDWGITVPLGQKFIEYLRNDGMHVEEGVFQTHMMVDLTNDGPVTILLDSKKTF